MTAPEQISRLVTEKSAPQRFYGKYRGTVENNVDPLRLGRILASVPSVSSVALLNWAMPCTPFPAGTPSLSVPPLGASIWIEFEAGDPNYPVWSGCFWATGQTRLLQKA
jgi:hypothetical protein